jgi:hypothetical protein
VDLECVKFSIRRVELMCCVLFEPFLQLMKKYSEREMAVYAKAGGVAEEALTNIRIVNAYAGQSKEVQRCTLQIYIQVKIAFKLLTSCLTLC